VRRYFVLALLFVVLCVSATAQIGTSKLTNRSGGIVTANEVVVVDTANASSFTTTTSEGDGGVLGIVYPSSIADDATGIVLLYGIVDVTCVGSVAIGDYLITSTTAGSAKSNSSDATGAFAIALEAGTDTEISCILMIDSSAVAIDDVSDDDVDALQDVDAYASQAAGDLLIWDGDSWVNKAVSGNGTVSSTGALAVTHLGFNTLVDADADRIVFWDDSGTTLDELIVGAGLTITDKTLSASGTPTIDLDDDAPILYGDGDEMQEEYDGATDKLQLSDGTNIFRTVTDDGTTATFAYTGSSTWSGDVAVNGGDITSTAGALNININGSRLNLDSGELEFENESTSSPVFGMYARDSGANTQLYGKLTCVITDSTNASEDSYWSLSAFAAGSEQTAVLKVEADGDVINTGDSTAQGGAVTAGVDGSERGILTVWDGAGGTTPGTTLFHSPDGTAYYMFFSDTGGLRYHTSLPTANADGSAIAGSMTSFTAAGDSGDNQTISDSDTFTVAGGSGIASVGSATDTITLSLGALTGNWTQSGAFDILLANTSSELGIMASGGTYYAMLEAGPLSATRTFTFGADESGYVPTVPSTGSDGQILQSAGDGNYEWRTPSTGSIILTAAGGKPDDTDACADAAIVEFGTINAWVLAFDPDTDEGAWWMLALPDDYAGGTMVPTFYYTVASDWAADTDKLNWTIAGSSIANSDAMSTVVGTAVEANDVMAGTETVDELLVITGGALTISGTPAAGDFVFFYVTRDANDGTNDTCTADGRLLSVRLEYTKKWQP